MASPHVAAAAALLLAQRGAMKPVDVRDRLRATADHVPAMGQKKEHPDYGTGRLNLLNYFPDQSEFGEGYADACLSLPAFCERWSTPGGHRGNQGWPEVSAANFLKREANNPEVRRIAFAEVPDERNLMEVLKRLQSLPVVATANLPAQRTLVEPAWKVVE
jgi:hypothetical protein